MSTTDPAHGVRRATTHEGQALLEVALVVPVVLLLVVGIVGLGRVQGTRNGLDVAAREAARAAAQGRNGGDAVASGLARGRELAFSHGLTNGSFALTVDARGLAPGDVVRTSASYEVRFGDLPLLGWANVTLRASGQEAIDQYRSRGR